MTHRFENKTAIVSGAGTGICIGRATASLASDEANFITGADFAVDVDQSL